MKRVFLAVVCMLTLPLLLSPSQNIQPQEQPPFSTVALAGHNHLGGWCECGSPDCICDPGEQPNRSKLQEPDPDETEDQPVDSENDLTPGLMALALALFFWFRMR